MKKHAMILSTAVLTTILTPTVAFAQNTHLVPMTRVAPVMAVNTNTNKIAFTINYQLNGKTLKTVTKQCDNGANVDIMPDMPSGYQVVKGWDVSKSPISVVDGKATVNVPIEKITQTATPKPSGNQTFTANITYTYNGKTVGTASATYPNGATIDISKNVPSGYQISSDYKGASNLPIKDGKVNLTIPVEPIKNVNDSHTFDAVINYISNGQTINSITLHNVKKGTPVNVSNDLPKGYQIASSYNPSASVPVVNGKVVFNVPVVKTGVSNTPTTSDSSNTQPTVNTPSTSDDKNNQPTADTSNSSTSDNGGSTSSNSTSDNTNSGTTDNTSSNTHSSNTDDKQPVKPSTSSSSGSQGDNTNSTVNSNTGDNNNAHDNVSTNETQGHSQSNSSDNQNNSHQTAGDKQNDKDKPTVTIVNDDKTHKLSSMNGDVPTQKIDYVDKNGKTVKNVDTKNGVANQDTVKDNLPSNTSPKGATYSFDKHGNLQVKLPQTGEATNNKAKTIGIFSTIAGLFVANIAYLKKRFVK